MAFGSEHPLDVLLSLHPIHYNNMASQAYTYILTPAAYTIPLLHAARNTAHTVLGIFLGSVDESTRQIIIQDAIPLLHHYASLSPIAEAGLTLLEEEARGRGLRLVGLYVAHEGQVNGLGRVGERILDGLKGGFDGVLGFTVSTTLLYTSLHYVGKVS